MGVSDEALGVIPGRTAPSADLGGSEFSPFFFSLMLVYVVQLCLIMIDANVCLFIGSKYSNENFED